MNLEKIYQARENIVSFVRKTPLELSYFLSDVAATDVHLKLENWQKTGSFKIRGALNKICTLTPEEKARGIITASAGNHGLGVACAARLHGISGKIVVPQNASQAKIRALERYDVELIVHGADYDDAEAIALEIQRNEQLTFVHAFDDAEIIAGQGTIALEILEQLAEVQTIVVPVGGGGLISGLAVAAKALRPEIRVVGVQSEASPAMVAALQAGKIRETPIAGTIADGLAGRSVSERTLHLVQTHVDDVILVSENAIRQAMRMLLAEEHMVAEGSAAVGVAALLEQKFQASGATVVIITGRNVAADVIADIA